MNLKRILSSLWTLVFILFSLPSHAHTQEPDLFDVLSTLCGNAYEGKVTSENKKLLGEGRHIMHVKSCTNSEISIAYNVGENRSRTWVISKIKKGLRLKHIHKHKGGSEDLLTFYGGESKEEERSLMHHFPADEFSKTLFINNDRAVSVENIWTMSILPHKVFSYQLNRPNLHVQVDFDLQHTVKKPKPSW